MEILALSKYIVHQFAKQSPDGITPMKLQKLLFYVKAWTLISDRKLVLADFEHWDYGPVNRDVYQHYKQYGSGSIDVNELDDFNINPSEKELIDFIVENYISFDAFTLSAMTHTEEPWKQTNRNELISEESIISYYSQQRFAKNFKPSLNLSNNLFYPLENHSFEIDMSEKDAEAIAKYSSYESYKKAVNQAEQDFKDQWSDFVLN
jgi:uncharacterized phage-associated protein